VNPKHRVLLLCALLSAAGCAQDTADPALETEADADAGADAASVEAEADADAAVVEAEAEADAAPEPDPDAAPAPDAASEPDPDPDAPGFADLYAALPSLQSCAGAYCHHPADNADDTSPEALWRWLTGPRDPSGLCADDPRPLIAPGDPEGSLLWAKVAPGVEVCGSKMPQTMEGGLSADDAERVRAWIAAGARP
jgi:hypothetical protein